MLRPITRRAWGILSAALALAAIPLALEAQTGQITGTVLDAETQAPMGTVQVFLQGTSHGALTGQDGRFTLSDVSPGRYTLVS
jgi:CarboxypepD_reg-like domain